MSNKTNYITIDQKKTDLPTFKNDHALYAYVRSLSANHYNRKLARLYKVLQQDGMSLDQIIEKFDLSITKQTLSEFIIKYGGVK